MSDIDSKKTKMIEIAAVFVVMGTAVQADVCRTVGASQPTLRGTSKVILLIIGGKMFPSALDIVIDNMHVVEYNYYFIIHIIIHICVETLYFAYRFLLTRMANNNKNFHGSYIVDKFPFQSSSGAQF